MNKTDDVGDHLHLVPRLVVDMIGRKESDYAHGNVPGSEGS